jgi:hypothetical protein
VVDNSVASKDSIGELLQANRSDESEEGISDRGKSSPSRAAIEAVSILRLPRKLSFNGGSEVRRVTGCQRRSRERNEMRERTGEHPAPRKDYNPSSLPHGPSKRVQRVVKRRTLRSHRTPVNRARWNQARSETESAGTGSRKKSGWQKSVGRIVAIA